MRKLRAFHKKEAELPLQEERAKLETNHNEQTQSLVYFAILGQSAKCIEMSDHEGDTLHEIVSFPARFFPKFWPNQSFLICLVVEPPLEK